MIESSLVNPGEQLTWSGNPLPVRYALKKAAYPFVFGLFFFIFMVFWIQGATSQSGMEFGLLGLPGLAIGLGMLLSPVWYFFRGTQTTYALTDQRAIIDIAAPLPRHISVPLNQIPFVDVRASTHTTGDVLFRGAVESQMSIGMIRPDGFIAIADAARVGQLLRSAIEKSINARPGRS